MFSVMDYPLQAAFNFLLLIHEVSRRSSWKPEAAGKKRNPFRDCWYALENHDVTCKCLVCDCNLLSWGEMKAILKNKATVDALCPPMGQNRLGGWGGG